MIEENVSFLLSYSETCEDRDIASILETNSMLKAGIQNLSGLFGQQIPHLLSVIGNSSDYVQFGCTWLLCARETWTVCSGNAS